MQRKNTVFFATIIYKKYYGTFKVAVTSSKDWASGQSFVFVSQRGEKKLYPFVGNLEASLELHLKIKMTEKDKLEASSKFSHL